MASGHAVRPNQYYDSVFLMSVNQRLARLEGVQETAVLMATERNKALLAEVGIAGDDIAAAGASDLIVAVIADSPEVVTATLGRLDEALVAVEASTPVSELHTLEDGLRAQPEANLALLSIPGGFVSREARKALEAGLNLFIFSSNVPVEDEQRLKQFARERRLLVMGPDCGTSILNGVGLGFANAVRRGTIGAIGPSGTGLQEFTCQVHQAGFGISHAIGTGSRDLSDDIGGLTTLTALERLESDRRTEVIAIVAKPGGTTTRSRLVDRLRTCSKPVVACLLGSPAPESAEERRVVWPRTIDAAVDAAIRLSGHPDRPAPDGLGAEERQRARQLRAAWAPGQRYLRGLFAGGTFCYQSQQILREAGLAAYSNAPLDADHLVAAFEKSREHTLIDMGDEVFTSGRLHPMIDSTLRRQRILTESADPSAAVLLVDFILGYNASPDPVGDIVDAIREGQRTRPAQAGPLAVVASICGTDQDPQDLRSQTERLRQAGVVVFDSNARATDFVRELLSPA